MTKAVWVVVALVSLGLLVQACSDNATGQLIKKPKQEEEPHYDTFLSAVELQGIIDHKNVRLVDLREGWEYNGGHIPNSINIPFSELELHRLRAEGITKDNRLILYDTDGSRSMIALDMTEHFGYNNVQVLEGGFNAWVGKEFILEQGY